MSDDETEPVARRHRPALRRLGSFNRLESVPQQINDWFHSDAGLHASWTAFADRHKAASPIFTAQLSASASTLVEADHKATVIHEKFCDEFEAQLSAKLDSMNLSMDQFQEAFRLSRDEEERNGTHFYRWPDVVEFEVFLVLMREGTQALLRCIDERSSAAKVEFRRKTSFFPLIVRWQPADLDELHNVTLEAAKRLGLDLRLSKAQQKEAIRWRTKLTTKVIGPDGVYCAPARDEEAWSRYIAFFTSGLSSEDLEALLGALDRHVKVDASVAPSGTASDENRKLLLQCFNALDSHHKGAVDLAHVGIVAAKAGVVSEKHIRRSLVRWNHKLDQQALHAKAVGKAEALEEAVSGRINLLQAIDLLTEMLKPVDGAGVDELFQARLKKVIEEAQDRS